MKATVMRRWTMGFLATNVVCFLHSLKPIMAFRSAAFLARSTASSRPFHRPRSLLTRGMSISKDSSTFESDFIQNQKQLSSRIQNDKNKSAMSQEQFTRHQEDIFNEMASSFGSGDTIPDHIVPIMQEMVQTVVKHMKEARSSAQERDAESRPARANPNATHPDLIDGTFRILDVGCGTGALFQSFVKEAQTQQQPQQWILHGIDLAPKMVTLAQQYAKEIMDKNYDSSDSPEVSITVQQGDICFSADEDIQDFGQYDLVLANACFGNFYDPVLAMQRMTDALKLNGVLCITHPLGSDFVRDLHDNDPATVPHLLPTKIAEMRALARTLPLQVEQVIDRPQASFYMAHAIKVVYQTLPNIMRLRGQIDTGYGRGGKKLGFPTANLPSRLFQDALANVPCGVYFGWALLEDSKHEKQGRNMAHKAVVNVGYSPTFEGQENKEKIVEAHLMIDKNSVMDPPDFYGETMRLQLFGFLRPEKKFPSFPDLIAQITTDVADAADALDLEFYQSFRKDEFLNEVLSTTSGAPFTPWTGAGGDAIASWEFQDVEEALEALGS